MIEPGQEGPVLQKKSESSLLESSLLLWAGQSFYSVLALNCFNDPYPLMEGSLFYSMSTNLNIISSKNSFLQTVKIMLD